MQNTWTIVILPVFRNFQWEVHFVFKFNCDIRIEHKNLHRFDKVSLVFKTVVWRRWALQKIHCRDICEILGRILRLQVGQSLGWYWFAHFRIEDDFLHMNDYFFEIRSNNREQDRPVSPNFTQNFEQSKLWSVLQHYIFGCSRVDILNQHYQLDRTRHDWKVDFEKSFWPIPLGGTGVKNLDVVFW